MLDSFPEHRHDGFYYDRENFGLLHVEKDGTARVQIVGEDGGTVGEAWVGGRNGTGVVEWEKNVPHMLDGKVNLWFVAAVMSAAVLLIFVLGAFRGFYRRRQRQRRLKYE